MRRKYVYLWLAKRREEQKKSCRNRLVWPTIYLDSFLTSTIRHYESLMPIGMFKQ